MTNPWLPDLLRAGATSSRLCGGTLPGGRLLAHEGGSFVDLPGTGMLLRDVDREAVRRDVFAAEATEGLAGRNLDALHPHQHETMTPFGQGPSPGRADRGAAMSGRAVVR